MSQQEIPYSKGIFITSPLVNYLKDNGYYNSYASGNIDDFGFIEKEIFGIPQNRFVKIETLSETNFLITYIVNDVDKDLHGIEMKMMHENDYDFSYFENNNYEIKQFTIKMTFEIIP